MAHKKQLCDYLKEARVRAGLSQKEVADKLGYVTPQFISNWERGISAPPVQSLKKIAGFYRIAEEELFEIYLDHAIADIKTTFTKRFQK